MKKTLLVLSAVLALSMAFVGCKKSTGGNEPDGSDPKTVANPVFVLTYNADAQYAAPEIAVADDWASIEIVFADDTPFDKMKYWNKYFIKNCEYYEFEGTHFFMKEHYCDIANIIKEKIGAINDI